MTRRIHVPVLRAGEIRLDPSQAHHARDVLRLETGCTVEVFDDAGATASAVLIVQEFGELTVHVTDIRAAAQSRRQWTVAAAVPKGDRADWMIEKLSELGAAAFIPLATARSVVLPDGKNKRERWMRIATEAAKQSRRSGVMKIESLMPLQTAIGQFRNTKTECRQPAWVLTTELSDAKPISAALAAERSATSLALFVGPEGGWTEQELAMCKSAGLTAVRLGTTILRVETAAIAVGAIVSCSIE